MDSISIFISFSNLFDVLLLKRRGFWHAQGERLFLNAMDSDIAVESDVHAGFFFSISISIFISFFSPFLMQNSCISYACWCVKSIRTSFEKIFFNLLVLQ
ncbi:unnamed protein product [Cuscuta epithymum]|uniref:Uncharacterized protein n=1 Tax=Cuscuta epithymum TaxID=186058 RepID=A0AAV0ELY6_9ASTE|nr:unnamed protein product [Cuscuta epithymum]